MSANDNTPTPAICFESLRPICDGLTKAIETAPMGPNGRAGLALMAAVYFHSLAASWLDTVDGIKAGAMPRAQSIREVSRLIEATVCGPRP